MKSWWPSHHLGDRTPLVGLTDAVSYPREPTAPEGLLQVWPPLNPTAGAPPAPPSPLPACLGSQQLTYQQHKRDCTEKTRRQLVDKPNKEHLGQYHGEVRAPRPFASPQSSWESRKAKLAELQHTPGMTKRCERADIGDRKYDQPQGQQLGPAAGRVP